MKNPPRDKIPVPPPRQYKLRPLPPMRLGAMEPNTPVPPAPEATKKNPRKKKGK